MATGQVLACRQQALHQLTAVACAWHHQLPLYRAFPMTQHGRVLWPHSPAMLGSSQVSPEDRLDGDDGLLPPWAALGLGTGAWDTGRG